MDAKKEETKWPDNARLKMLDKAQFYEPNEKIYHYGFYDGYQFCKEEYASPLKERIKELEKEIQEFCDRVEKGEIRSVKTYTKFKYLLSQNK